MKRASIYIAVAAILIAATSLWAQSNPTNSNPSAAPAATNSPSEMEQLRAMVLAQQKQLEAQQKQIQELQQQMGKTQPVSAAATDSNGRVMNASLNTTAATRTVQPASDAPRPPQETKPKESPLSFRIG